MGKKIQGITVAIGADTTGVTNGLKDIAKQSTSVNGELRDVERLLKLNPSNVELVAQKQQLLSKQVEITTRKLDGLKGAQADVDRQFNNGDIGEEQYRAFQREIVATEGRLDHYKQTLQSVESGNESAGGSTKGLGDKFDDLGNSVEEVGSNVKAGVLIEAADQLSEIGDKITEIGEAAKDFALETDESYGKLYANTNLSGQALENLKGVAQDVFKSGVTDSIDEATEATAVMKQAFGDLDNISLANLTSQVMSLSERTGTDVQENVKGTQQLMNAFGLDSKKAFDLVADGYKNGLNSSGDFMDTLNEYAPLFQQAGFSAQDMLSIMQNGLKNGAMNTDKVADAVKELQIRLGDGSFEANMETFSSATQETFKKWQAGKATVADVAQSIQNDLNKMSPSEQQVALSALSSQFEDLGIKAGTSLFNIGTEFDNVSGKLDEATQKTQAQEWQAALNDIKAALLPIGTDILNTLRPVLDFIGKMMDGFNKLPGPIKTFVESFGGLIAVVTILTPIIASIAALFVMFSSTIGIVVAVIVGVITVISGIIVAIKNWGAITDWLTQKWNDFSKWLGNLWNGIKEITENVWNSITEFLSDLWSSIVDTATAIFTPIINIITVIFMTIQSVLEGIWLVITSLLKTYWNMIVSLATVIFTPIIEFFSGIWNSISTKLSEVWSYISEALMNGWNSIVSMASTIFTPIVTFMEGVWNSISNATVSIWSTVTAFLSGVWDNIKNVASGIFNAISSTISGIWNSISSTLSGIWNGIASTMSSVFNGMKNTIGGIFEGIKNTATNVWNSIKSAITSPIEEAKNTVSQIIETIKGFFSGLKLSFPKVDMPPLPHFSIKGNFSLNPPSVPHLDVDWFAKGGILTKPTVFGQNGNSLMVGGEAGKEAVAPLSDLMGYVEKAVANQLGATKDEIHLHLTTYGAMPKETMDQMAEYMMYKLGELNRQKGLG
jgi:Phage-related minor tail protein